MKRTLKWTLCIAMIALIAMSTVIIGSAAYSQLDGLYVNLAAGESFEIELCPEVDGLYTFYSTGEVDTVASVYDNEGNFLGYNDDGFDRNFNLSVKLTGGKTYYLSASLYGQHENGEFWVSSELTPIMDVTSEEFEVTVSYNEDVYYEFTPEVDGIYEIYSVSEGTDPNVVLYDSLMNEIGYNDDSQHPWSDNFNDFRISGYFEAGESYIIKLHSYLHAYEEDETATFSVAIKPCEMTTFAEDGTAEISSSSIYVEFTPEVSGFYELSSAGSYDVRAVVYNEYFDIMYRDDDSGEGSNFTIKNWFYAGVKYYLELNCYEALDVSYSVSIKEYTLKEFSADNTVDLYDNVEFIKFVPEVSGIYGLSSTGDFDTYCALYDSDMIRFGGDEDSGEGSNFTIDVYLNAGETYYLEVYVYESFGNPIEFKVHNKLYSSLEFSEDNTLSISDEAAFIKFVPEEDNLYRFYSTGNFDTYITLYSEYFKEIDFNDNSGEASNFELEINLTEGYTYYLKVSSRNAIREGSSYRVVWENVEDTLTDHVTIEITEEDHDRYYLFTPEEGGLYNFYASASENVYASWEVYDSVDKYTLVGSGQVSGRDGYDFECACYLDGGRTYYIYVLDGDSLGNTESKTGWIDLYVEKAYDGWFLMGNHYDISWVWIVNGERVANQWAVSPEGWVYLDEYGNAVTESWIEDSQGWLYLDYHGAMATNEIVPSFDYSSFHYVDANGRIVKAQWVYITDSWFSSKPHWSYFDSDGFIVRDEWFSDNRGWMYVNFLGVLVTDDIAWGEGDLEVYYMDSDDYMVTNRWINFSEEDGYEESFWAYFGADGVVVRNQWIADSHGWCYVNDEAIMVTNAWVMDSQGWCYIGDDGYCVTSQWVEDSYGWCYLDENGRMATNQWIMDSQGWCYVGADGYCLTNCWQKDSYGWCYLDENGRMATNTWVKDGGVWYYLDSEGYMVTGTHIIDGVSYTFNDYGVWVA